MVKQKLVKNKLRGGNIVQRGGGILSFIWSLPGRIYTFTMYFALFNIMIIPIGVIFLLYVMYKTANMVLFGTNWIIDLFNDTIMVAVRGIVDVLNSIEAVFS
jgi:hypothetical protein